MDTDTKMALGFFIFLFIVLGGAIFSTTINNQTYWEKIDNSGNCYVKVDVDRQFLGGGSTTRSTYCKE